MRTVRLRFWIETVAAGGAGLLAVITLFWHDWIEIAGWNPDNHSGAAEWLVVGVLVVIAIAAATAARLEWRRPLPAT